MNWYNYVACFFAGAFLANSVPHYVYGVCGDRFPTPSARPPGNGLSSPTVNVLWALLNLLIGYILFRAGRGWTAGIPAPTFAGIAAMSLTLSLHFARKHSK